MQQIAADHAANREYKLKLYHFPIRKSNVLFYKAFIETLRVAKQVAILLSLLLVFPIVIHRIPLFASIPVIGEPNMSKFIGMLSFAVFLTNLKEIYHKQVLSMLSKKRKGLFLPYNDFKIILSYSRVCCLVITLSMIVVSIILQTNPYRAILSWIVILFGFHIAFWDKSRKQYRTLMSNLVIFSATYFIF